LLIFQGTCYEIHLVVNVTTQYLGRPSGLHGLTF